jgi:hypothetical protein
VKRRRRRKSQSPKLRRGNQRPPSVMRSLQRKRKHPRNHWTLLRRRRLGRKKVFDLNLRTFAFN